MYVKHTLSLYYYLQYAKSTRHLISEFVQGYRRPYIHRSAVSRADGLQAMYRAIQQDS